MARRLSSRYIEHGAGIVRDPSAACPCDTVAHAAGMAMLAVTTNEAGPAPHTPWDSRQTPSGPQIE